MGMGKGEEEKTKTEGAGKRSLGRGGKREKRTRKEVRKADMEEGKDIHARLVETKRASTRAEARSMGKKGGVTVNDVKVTDVYKTFTADDLDEDRALIIRKGKKVYHKVKCED